MQAMEDIDRPFVCGGRSELASEGAAMGSDDKSDRPAAVGGSPRRVCAS